MLNLWFAAQTQWRVGMAGATGLDYAGVDALLRIEGVRGDERRTIFAGLRIMEAEALREWADQRARG